jgi:hypothetical protein
VLDHTQRRGWRLLVGVIGFGIVPIAVPIGILSGIPISALVTPVVGPLQFVLSLLVIPLSFIVWIVAETLRPFAGPLGELLDQIQRANEERERRQQAEQLANDLISDVMTIVGLALWAFTILVLVIAIYGVARWLLRRRHVFVEDLDDGDADTEHAILVPIADQKQSLRRRGRRPSAPHDAVAAYLGALAELEDHPDLARLPTETPAQHAARLRASGMDGAREVARLAAAYQLARYGERRITVLENVRAVSRFQRVRRLLRASNA